MGGVGHYPKSDKKPTAEIDSKGNKTHTKAFPAQIMVVA